MQAYDKPAQDAALIRIDEINKAGGLLGKKIKAVFADTKTDQAEGAKAGLAVLDQGADLVVVSCDYDFGAPAALQAQAAGKVSFFLCADVDWRRHPRRRSLLVLRLGTRGRAGARPRREQRQQEERS